jgi:hypothetical protein
MSTRPANRDNHTYASVFSMLVSEEWFVEASPQRCALGSLNRFGCACLQIPTCITPKTQRGNSHTAHLQPNVNAIKYLVRSEAVSQATPSSVD